MPTFDQIENGSVYEEDKYLHAFRHLNVNKRGNKISPHKPILLFAVMELVEMGEVVSPFIPISKELEETFKRVWERYVPEGEGHSCAMQYTFYHMRSEPFWRLMPLPWCLKKSSYSLRELRRNFYGAIIDGELFEAFRDDTVRAEMKWVLEETYLRPVLLKSDDGISPRKKYPRTIGRVIDDAKIAAESEESYSKKLASRELDGRCSRPSPGYSIAGKRRNILATEDAIEFWDSNTIKNRLDSFIVYFGTLILL